MLFDIELREWRVVPGSLVPKLVGEKKTRNDDIQSVSASVFFVLYPALADYILSVLKDANLCMNSSQSQSTARHCTSETSPLPGLNEDCQVGDTAQSVDVTETQPVLEDTALVVTSSLLFPVLSLLSRLSPGLEVADEGKK